MKNIFLKLLVAYLAKVNGQTEDEVASLILEKKADGTYDEDKVLDGGLDAILAKDTERVTKLKGEDPAKKFTEGLNKGKKEALEGLEKQLREAYGVDEDSKLKGAELVKAVVEKTKAPLKAGDLKDDDVKKHPVYLQLEAAKNKALEDAKAEHEAKVKEIETGHAKKETLQGVKSEVFKAFDALKPVLSKDAAKAARSRERFAAQFEGYTYEKQADGSYLIIDKDGKRLEDKHGNPKKLNDLVKETAEQEFEFVAQDPKGNGGNGGGGGTGSGGVKLPKTEEEFNEMVLNEPDPAKRAEISTAWEAAQGGNAT